MSLRKLIKLKHKADSLGIKIDSLDVKTHHLDLAIQQLRGDLRSLKHEMKREAEQPFVSNEVGQSHEDNKVDFNLPSIFDDYGEEEKEEE